MRRPGLLLLLVVVLAGVGALVRADSLRRMAYSRRKHGDVYFHSTADRHLTQAVLALIQGGQDAKAGRYPYMTSLRDREDAHTCGGVLIHENWVVSAAHCLDPTSNVNGMPLGLNPQVAIGALKLSDDASVPGVEVVLGEVFLHESWTGDLLNGFDIALIKLPEPSQLQPVRLAARGSEFVTGQPFVAVGWGSQGNGRSNPDTLKWATVIHRDNTLCNLESVWNSTITPEMLCAGGTIGDTADVCKGDSGGPLLLAHAPAGKEENGDPKLDLLVGLVSYGELPGCDTEEPFEFRKPIVYTRISEFRDWIDQTIGDDQILDEQTPVTDQQGDETESPTGTETAPDSSVSSTPAGNAANTPTETDSTPSPAPSSTPIGNAANTPTSVTPSTVPIPNPLPFVMPRPQPQVMQRPAMQPQGQGGGNNGNRNRGGMPGK